MLVLLSLVLVGCSYKINYGATTKYLKGVEIEFGQYPRSEVDESLSKELEEKFKLGELEKNGQYYVFGGKRYARVVVQNNYPHAETLSEAFEENSDEDFERFTGYVVGSVHWFEVEPIVWKVLNTQNGLAVLTTKELVDCTFYGADSGEEREYVWENSHLRKFLNEEFFEKAFSEDERKLIRTTETECAYISNPGRLKYLRTSVEDKVRVLTWEEARLPKQFANDLERVAKTTDYASAMGGARVTEKVILDGGKDVEEFKDFLGAGIYWLLDTELNMNNVYIVYEFGNTLSYNPMVGNRTVRPVIVLTEKEMKKLK